MAEKVVDILIIGGGSIGMTLALALQDSGYSSLLVENTPFKEKASEGFDARTLALSPSSMRIFQSLGVWSALKAYATPVESIHISEASRFGAARLQGTLDNPLGFILEMQHLVQTLQAHLEKAQWMAPARLTRFDSETNTAFIQSGDDSFSIKTKLLIAADGADSDIRGFCNMPCIEKNWNQQAITVNLAFSRKHHNHAFERLTREGPMAFLPMSDNRMALVWTVRNAARYMEMSDSDFMKMIQEKLGYRAGKVTCVGKRNVWPVRSVIMPKQVTESVVFLGNAAHTLHPIAAQGFNLGLRDVATLVQCILEGNITPSSLERYKTLRHHDQSVITKSTNFIAECFTSNIPGMGWLRSTGFFVLDNLSGFKTLFSQYACGFGGYVPDMALEREGEI